MKIIKRNGSEAVFDITKIIVAITKANNADEHSRELSQEQIVTIASNVEESCLKMGRAPSVEEIQDLVENQIMQQGAFEVAKRYIRYRYTRSLARRANTTDNQILSLIECNNEEAKQENANKNPTVNSVQRDYMAGEVSKDITRRILLPQDIVEAHEQGLIHFHVGKVGGVQLLRPGGPDLGGGEEGLPPQVGGQLAHILHRVHRQPPGQGGLGGGGGGHI